MKPLVSFVVEFGWCGWRISKRDVRLGLIRIWACRRSVLDQITERRVLVMSETQPRDWRGRFARVK